jgi:hypothetical protein
MKEEILKKTFLMIVKATATEEEVLAQLQELKNHKIDLNIKVADIGLDTSLMRPGDNLLDLELSNFCRHNIVRFLIKEGSRPQNDSIHLASFPDNGVGKALFVSILLYSQDLVKDEGILKLLFKDLSLNLDLLNKIENLKTIYSRCLNIMKDVTEAENFFIRLLQPDIANLNLAENSMVSSKDNAPMTDSVESEERVDLRFIVLHFHLCSNRDKDVADFYLPIAIETQIGVDYLLNTVGEVQHPENVIDVNIDLVSLLATEEVRHYNTEFMLPHGDYDFVYIGAEIV